jgi:hypothetical protein
MLTASTATAARMALMDMATPRGSTGKAEATDVTNQPTCKDGVAVLGSLNSRSPVMNQQDRRTEAVTVAREVLQRAAPDQLAEFDAYAVAWTADPKRAQRAERHGDGPLGSGLDADLPALAPLALYIVHHVLDAGVNVTFEEAIRRTWSRIRRVRKKGGHAEAPAESPDPQAIEEKALEAGKKIGAPPEDVRLVANILVFVLTAATPQELPETPTPATVELAPEESEEH